MVSSPACVLPEERRFLLEEEAEDESHLPYSIPSPLMLKKRDRLRAAEIKEVLTRKAIPVSTSFFSIRVLRKITDTPFESKFAVTVTKRIYKSAVDRHHLKRRVMQALRLTKGTFPKNLFISIMPRKETSVLSFEELVREVENISKRIKKG